MIKPLKNNVFFQFVDDIDSTKNNMFVEKTSTGLILPGNARNSAGSARWVEVAAVGPDCKSVEAGMTVLVEPGKWTNEIKLKEGSYWKTDEDWVIAISD